jgi:hypothetical protein
MGEPAAMPRRKHVLFTLANSNVGDFLIKHWLVSLQNHVTLDNIEIVVLDYGLTDGQRSELEKQGVVCRPCENDGLLNNVCFRDACAHVKEGDYDQVVLMDCGDIIFQADIIDVFETNKDKFRGVCEQVNSSRHDYFMSRQDFTPENWSKIAEYLRGKPVINGSCVWGPASKYRDLWSHFEKWCISFDAFCSNQYLMNYLLYNWGFVELPAKYNFVLVTAKKGFTIKDGVFYDADGEIVPIVHNAGGSDRYRFVSNFGYGKQYNRMKRFTPPFLRAVFAVLNWYKGIRYPMPSDFR